MFAAPRNSEKQEVTSIDVRVIGTNGLGQAFRGEKREDKIFIWARYWYERTRILVLVACE